MRCNNKYILEGNDENRKFLGKLLSYVNYEIKDNNHEIIIVEMDGHNKEEAFLCYQPWGQG